MSNAYDEYQKMGYKKAQKQIAKRLFEKRYKEWFISEITGLPTYQVISIVHQEEIQEMLAKGWKSDVIAIILVPIHF